MTITIEQNFYNPIPSIKQWYREFTCKRKGHKYENYKRSPFLLTDFWLMRQWAGDIREPYKECTRCFKMLYKKVKEEEQKVIKFKRYTDLAPKKEGKSATEMHLKK